MSTRDVPPRRELEIRDADRAAGSKVGKVVGLAVDGCYSHKASHCGCTEGSVGPIYARFPGGSTDVAAPKDLDELEEISAPMVVDCPAATTKHDGEVVVVLRSPYDHCHVVVAGVARVVAGEPHSPGNYLHAVTVAPDLIDAEDAPISVSLAQVTASPAEHPAPGLYLGSMRGQTDQGQQAGPRHVLIYVHGVQIP